MVRCCAISEKRSIQLGAPNVGILVSLQKIVETGLSDLNIVLNVRTKETKLTNVRMSLAVYCVLKQ